ncbi:thioredoxin family protein [Pseudonocardia sp. GCM10023141]|uniref:thioredoxin family protein n=1 Tax=Pseudonocardia sp. GCM10023141 TaxID=3252653 RepID=UPI00360F6F73
MIVTVTDATYEELVLRAELPVLLDFTAEWCPPCRMITPVLREIAVEQAGRLVVAQLDVDADPGTPAALGVLAMPTLVLFSRGEIVARSTGAKPKAALLRLLDEHLLSPLG